MKEKKEELKYGGGLTDFPPEVVEKMLYYQEKHGNPKDVSIFEKTPSHNVFQCGFNWNSTKEGYSFWNDVILNHNFELFFERYPKHNMGTVASIQEAINKRAKAKLEKDLDFLTEILTMKDSKYAVIFDNVYVDIGTSEKPKVVKAFNVFRSYGRLYREAFDKNIDRYIKEETELLLAEIKDLQEWKEKMNIKIKK